MTLYAAKSDGMHSETSNTNAVPETLSTRVLYLIFLRQEQSGILNEVTKQRIFPKQFPEVICAVMALQPAVLWDFYS